MKYFWIVLTLVGCLLLPSAAHAVLITHNGVELVSDNFEDDTVGANPTSPPWFGKNGGAMPTTMFVDNAVGGALGSANYLVFDRDDNSKNPDDGRGEIHYTPVSTGTVKADLMVYLPSTNNVGGGTQNEARIGFGNGFGYGTTLDLHIGGGQLSGPGKIDWFDGTGWAYTGVDYVQDTWQRWEIEVNLDTGIVDLTVDGSSNSWDYGATGFEMTELDFEAGWAAGSGPPHNKIYIDAVPEPSTLALLLSSAFAGVALYRRRRR